MMKSDEPTFDGKTGTSESDDADYEAPELVEYGTVAELTGTTSREPAAVTSTLL